MFSTNINVSGKFMAKLLTSSLPEFASLIDPFLLVNAYRFKWKFYSSLLYIATVFFHLIGKYIYSKLTISRSCPQSKYKNSLCVWVHTPPKSNGEFIKSFHCLSQQCELLSDNFQWKKIITWTWIPRVCKLFCKGPGSKHANMALWTAWIGPHYPTLLYQPQAAIDHR